MKNCRHPAVFPLTIIVCALCAQALSAKTPPPTPTGFASCGGVAPFAPTNGRMTIYTDVSEPQVTEIFVQCRGAKENAQPLSGASMQSKLDELKVEEAKGNVRWSVLWFTWGGGKTWYSQTEKSYAELLKSIKRLQKIQRAWDKFFGTKTNKPETRGWWKHTAPKATVRCDGAGGSKPADGNASTIQNAPDYPGDISAYNAALDESPTWRERLLERFGEKARPALDAFNKFDNSLANFPSASFRYWIYSAIEAGNKFFKPLKPEFSLREYWRRMQDSWKQARRLQRFMDDLLAQPIADINRVSGEINEAADFASRTTETTESLWLPSSKSFAGTYRSINLADLGDYFGFTLADRLVKMVGESAGQVHGTVAIESLPDGRIRIMSPLGTFIVTDPASLVDLRKFLRTSADGSDVAQGGVFGKVVTIVGAPPGDKFKTAAFFIPPWTVTLANSKVGNIGAGLDIPAENWFWFSYQSTRTEGVLGQPALYTINFVYRSDGQHFLHIFDVGRFEYGLYALDPVTSIDVRNPPMLGISGPRIVTKAGYKVLEVPVGGSVTLEGSWSADVGDIRWRRDLITVQKGGSKLVLRNIDKSDEGLYVISGSNKEGTGMSETVAVIVTGADREKPALAVGSKPTHAGASDLYALSGTAADNVRPWRVQFRTKAPGAKAFGDWSSLNFSGREKTQTWAFIVKLDKIGQWQFEVVALDAAKNASAIRSFSVNRTK